MYAFIMKNHWTFLCVRATRRCHGNGKFSWKCCGVNCFHYFEVILIKFMLTLWHWGIDVENLILCVCMFTRQRHCHGNHNFCQNLVERTTSTLFKQSISTLVYMYDDFKCVVMQNTLCICTHQGVAIVIASVLEHLLERTASKLLKPLKSNLVDVMA